MGEQRTPGQAAAAVASYRPQVVVVGSIPVVQCKVDILGALAEDVTYILRAEGKRYYALQWEMLGAAALAKSACAQGASLRSVEAVATRMHGVVGTGVVARAADIGPLRQGSQDLSGGW
jgi:hypothetical protein